MSVYDTIFDAYIKDLRIARDEVLEWWNGLLADAAPGGDLHAAEHIVRPRWPAGAVSHPRIIAVYRQYFLAINVLNEEMLALRDVPDLPADDKNDGWGEGDEDEADGIIEPRFMLLDGLEQKDPELAEFMSRFVFAPIGSNPEDDAA